MRLTIYKKMMMGFMAIILLMSMVSAYMVYELDAVSNAAHVTLTSDVQSINIAKQLRAPLEAALVPYPHVNITLVELVKRGLRLAVVSDAPGREAWLRLCYLNFHHIFDYVVTFEDTGERKPSPAPFRKALELLSIEPYEAIMVGDWAERDMVGAAAVGMITVFARYGDTFGTIETNANYEINDISELLAVVDTENQLPRRA